MTAKMTAFCAQNDPLINYVCTSYILPAMSNGMKEKGMRVFEHVH
jgi:hypothetical protein